MNARPYCWLLNSTGKMLTCLRINQKSFEVLYPVHKYTKIRISKKRYQTYTVYTWSIPALRYLGVDHFGILHKKIYGKQEML